jgi:RND family efflux transporter MFP subunit
MKKTLLTAFAVLALSLISWRVHQQLARPQGGRSPKQGRSAAVAVVIQPVRRETILEIQRFTGTLLPKEQFLVAPKVAGRLEKLHVNIGQPVKNGELIAQLDTMELDQQVNQARAELEVARAAVIETQSAFDTAVRELDRATELRKQRVASEAEMDQAQARRQAALAKHEVALALVKHKEAALKADEVRLSYAQIRASWENGTTATTRVVGERFVDEGTMLRANEPMVSILEIDTVIAVISGIEQDYPKIRIGQPASIDTDAFPGRSFTGTIVRKAPLLKESSRQARVEIEISNPDRLLVPGMFVRAGIQFAAHDNATVVPASALVRRNDRQGVFVADPATLTAHFVPVTPGIVTAQTVEIIDPGLSGQVVTLGHHLLEEGGAIVIPALKTPGTPNRDAR